MNIKELGTILSRMEDAGFTHRELNNERIRKAALHLMEIGRRTTPDREAWQPIETAPKDGTQLLLSNGADVEQGWWMHDEGGIIEHRDMDGRYTGQTESDGFIGWWDVSGCMEPEPTHWMPLPTVPTSDKGGA